MTRLLFVSTPIYGHVSPLLSIAADLVGRGHDATFATGPAFEDAVRATGSRFVPFHGAADVDVDAVIQARGDLASGPEQINHDMTGVFIAPLAVQHELIQQELAAADGDPVVLITDSWAIGGWPVALGAPGIRPAATIGVGVSVLTALSTDAGPYGLGLVPDATPAGRARHAEVNAGYRQAMAPTQALLEQVLGELGVTGPVPFFFDGLAVVPDRTLQLSPAGFEYPRSDAPVGVRYIGPLPAAPPAADQQLPSWWDDVLRAERVAVVSQGTIANQDTTALFAPALRALADLDALVVLTTGTNGPELTDVPANARVAGFIPFDLLLPHTDVLVTNAGYGGVLKALSHGVPMVAAGDTEDKPEVAAHVAWSGAGIDLGTGHPDDQALGDAVRTVLSDPSYEAAARRLQAEIATHRPYDEIAAQIDELLAAVGPAAAVPAR